MENLENTKEIVEAMSASIDKDTKTLREQAIRSIGLERLLRQIVAVKVAKYAEFNPVSTLDTLTKHMQEQLQVLGKATQDTQDTTDARAEVRRICEERLEAYEQLLYQLGLREFTYSRQCGSGYDEYCVYEIDFAAIRMFLKGIEFAKEVKQ